MRHSVKSKKYLNLHEQFVIKKERDIESAACTLVLLVGSNYLSYAIHDNANNVCELKRFYFQQTTTNKLDTILAANPVLNNAFSGIVTAFDFNANSLLPVDFDNGDNTSLLYLNESGQQDHIIHEMVKEWELVNVYSIPYDLLNWVLTHFPSSKFWHAQSVQMKNTPKGKEGGCINLELADKSFSLTVSKAEQLLLAQRYVFATPDDVLFYLLKICEMFGLSQEEVQLNISGLINKNSILFRTLYDYFLNIELKAASWAQGNEYPAHYFTFLNQLALCES